jgi:beta-xylosidase
MAPQIIRSSPYGIAEGSHIIKRRNYYCLFTAEGGTESGHQEWVSRSENGQLGPWILGPRNPLWYNGIGDEVQNTGHADVFEDSEDNWWAVSRSLKPAFRIKTQTWLSNSEICRCFWELGQDKLTASGKGRRLVETHHWTCYTLTYFWPGRETFLVRVHWMDDWPVFNYGQKIGLTTISTNGLREYTEAPRHPGLCTWNANLQKDDLELGWYQKSEMFTLPSSALRGESDKLDTPLKPSYSLTERPGYLRLHGNC